MTVYAVYGVQVSAYDLSLLKLRLLNKHYDLGERGVRELVLDKMREVWVLSSRTCQGGSYRRPPCLPFSAPSTAALGHEGWQDQEQGGQVHCDVQLAKVAFISISVLLVVEELVRCLEDEMLSDLDRGNMVVDGDTRLEKLLRIR